MTSPNTPNSVHTLPAAQQAQQSQITSQQLKAMGSQLIQTVVNAVLSIISGGLLGGNFLSTIEGDISGVFTDLGNIFGNIFSIFGIGGNNSLTGGSNPLSGSTSTFNVSTWWANILADSSRLGNIPQGSVSGLEASILNALTNLINPSRLQQVPVAHVSSAQPNVLTDPDFLDSTLVGWDGTVTHSTVTGAGSWKVIPDGGDHVLLSDDNSLPIAVDPNSEWSVSAWVEYTSVTATGTPLMLGVAEYDSSVTLIGTTNIVVSACSGTATWAQLIGTYVTPASGVSYIRISLEVTAAATAGTGIWWSDCDLHQTGILDGSLVQSITGTLKQDLQDLTDGIHQATQGGSSTGNPFSLANIKSWLTSIPQANVNGLTTATTNLSTLITNLFGGGSIGTKVQTAALPDITPTESSGIQNLLNGITAYLGGLPGVTGAAQPDANMAMDAMFTNLSQNSQAIQQLQASQTATSSTGSVVNINFSDYSNGALPAIFTSTYTGTGTSTCVVSGGKAAWSTVADANVMGIFQYNVAPTVTDYQSVGFTGTTGPAGGSGEYVFARMNAAGDTYVYARAYNVGILAFDAEIGCVVSGVKTVFATGISMPLAVSDSLICGDVLSPYNFSLVSGGSTVYTYSDTAMVSQVGSSYRYWGFGGSVAVSGSTASAPGNIASISVVDHLPPTIIGTTFRAHRGNVTGASLTSDAEVPSGTFDGVDTQSLDLSWDGQSVTVTSAGTYMVHIRLQVGWSAGSGGYATVYKNGTLYDVGPWSENQLTVGVSKTNAAQMATMVYCAAGDVITPGWHASVSSSAKGESTGTQTFFEVALMNP